MKNRPWSVAHTRIPDITKSPPRGVRVPTTRNFISLCFSGAKFDEDSKNFGKQALLAAFTNYGDVIERSRPLSHVRAIFKCILFKNKRCY